MKQPVLILSILAAACLARLAFAGNPEPVTPGPWKFDAIVGLNIAQSSFSSNWKGGDKGSFVWVLNNDLVGQRQFSPKFNLMNELQLAYGQTASQVNDPDHPDRRRWDAPEKSTDLIQFESTGRFTLEKFVDPYLSFHVDSQFQDQSNPAGTLNFNPVNLKETAGIARVFEKTDTTEFISRLGFGFRQSFARNFVGASRDSIVRFSTNDGGIEWQTNVTQPVLGHRVLYKGRLLAFMPVFYSQSGALREFDVIAAGVDPNHQPVRNYWRVPDVDFQNTFTAKITKVVAVNLFMNMVYDKFDAATDVDLGRPPDVLIAGVDRGIRKAVQWKQTLAIGLSYTLF